MIWIDFVLLWYASFRTCRNLCGWASLWEKWGLAFILALALKSLILFFLIRIGVKPTVVFQMCASVLVLMSTLFLSAKSSEENRVDQESWVVWITLIGVGALFILSMANAWFFPITESDATWSVSYTHLTLPTIYSV